MRVNPNSDLSGVLSTPKPTTSRAAAASTDSAGLTGAKALDDALLQTPAVRAEMVAQAQKLILDSSYPPMELIQKISALLADQMGAKGNPS